MAEVYLRSEGGQDIIDLPWVCMCCGAPATVLTSKLFLQTPSSSPLLRLLMRIPLVNLIVLISLTKRQRVETPFCERHKGYWWKYPLLMWLLFLGMFGFDALGLIALSSAFKGNNPENDMIRAGSGIVGCLIVIIQLVILLVILMNNRSIRPIEITKRYIHLTGVSEEFADSIEDLEAREQVGSERGEYRPRLPRTEDDSRFTS